jgi:hypothetical protein
MWLVRWLMSLLIAVLYFDVPDSFAMVVEPGVVRSLMLPDLRKLLILLGIFYA